MLICIRMGIRQTVAMAKEWNPESDKWLKNGEFGMENISYKWCKWWNQSVLWDGGGEGVQRLIYLPFPSSQRKFHYQFKLYFEWSIKRHTFGGGGWVGESRPWLSIRRTTERWISLKALSDPSSQHSQFIQILFGLRGIRSIWIVIVMGKEWKAKRRKETVEDSQLLRVRQNNWMSQEAEFLSPFLTRWPLIWNGVMRCFASGKWIKEFERERNSNWFD